MQREKPSQSKQERERERERETPCTGNSEIIREAASPRDKQTDTHRFGKHLNESRQDRTGQDRTGQDRTDRHTNCALTLASISTKRERQRDRQDSTRQYRTGQTDTRQRDGTHDRTARHTRCTLTQANISSRCYTDIQTYRHTDIQTYRTGQADSKAHALHLDFGEHLIPLLLGQLLRVAIARALEPSSFFFCGGRLVVSQAPTLSSLSAMGHQNAPYTMGPSTGPLLARCGI